MVPSNDKRQYDKQLFKDKGDTILAPLQYTPQYNLCKEIVGDVPYANPHQLLDLLQELNLHWFAFAKTLEAKMRLSQ